MQSVPAKSVAEGADVTTAAPSLLVWTPIEKMPSCAPPFAAKVVIPKAVGGDMSGPKPPNTPYEERLLSRVPLSPL